MIVCYDHFLSPSEIPNAANICALKNIGVEEIVSFSAVGSLREKIAPMDFVLPNQIIDRTKLASNEWKEWGSRGIWFIDSVRRNDDHEAKFPLELAQRVVKLFSDKGDVVLDPFMGSGTTAIAALSTGRNFIGLEKESKYVELSNSKVTEFLKQQNLDI